MTRRRADGSSVRGGRSPSRSSHLTSASSTRRVPRVSPSESTSPSSGHHHPMNIDRPLLGPKPDHHHHHHQSPSPSERNARTHLSVPRIKTELFAYGITHNTPMPFHDSPTSATTNGENQFTPGPINFLPQEIIENILLFTFLPPDPFALRSNLFPVSLRRVCRSWRNIIDLSHLMWRSLNPVLSPFDSGTFSRGHFLDWYKQVTGGIPTFNAITIQLPDRPFLDTALLQYLFQLCAKSSAIKLVIPPTHIRVSPVLDIFAPNPRADDHRRAPHGPILDKLCALYWDVPNPFSRPFPTSLNLPWSSLDALPWHQLSTVELYLPMSLQDCVFIFNHAKLLERVVLRNISQFREGVQYPEHKPELAHLHSLEIESEFNLFELFQAYAFPLLRKLNLRLDRNALPNLLPLPWHQLSEVVLACNLTLQTAQGLFRRLDRVEHFEWKGILTDDEGWSPGGRLASLKTFKASPDRGGFEMANHLVRQILPCRIENVDIPLIPSLALPEFHDTFTSLRKATLNKAITPEDFFLFLSHVPSLQEGTFTVEDARALPPASSSSSSPSIPVPPTSHPHPHPPTPSYPRTQSHLSALCLELNLERAAHTEQFFNSLSLPNVTSLDLQAHGPPPSPNCDCLVAMLERDRCPVTKLYLRCQMLSEEGIVRCLRAVSATLVDFKVDTSFASQFGGQTFRALTHEPMIATSTLALASTSRIETATLEGGGDCLCPQLERFDVSTCTPGDTLEPLRLMIHSRSRFGRTCGRCRTTIKKLDVVKVQAHILDKVGDVTVDWKKKWKKKGICVELEFADVPDFRG